MKSYWLNIAHFTWPNLYKIIECGNVEVGIVRTGSVFNIYIYTCESCRECIEKHGYSSYVADLHAHPDSPSNLLPTRIGQSL
jgi:hypothetical protein